MRLLDRYLLRELLIPFAYCQVGVLIFWISFDLFAELADFQKNNLSAHDVVAFYAVRMPEMVVMVLPIAFLLGLLYALTNHSRHHELTAMRAAGVSLPRLTLPYLLVGVLLSLGSFAINELWVAQSQEAAEAIMGRHRESKGTQRSGTWESNLGFTNTREKRSWLIEAYNVVSGEMIKPHLRWTLGDGTRREILAEQGRRLDGVWVFTNVNLLVYPIDSGAAPESFAADSLSMPELSETPEQIRSEIKISKLNNYRSVRRTQLSIREILEYLQLHPGDTDKTTMLYTKLHGRLAAPWTCLVVVLIAIPFGAAGGRRNVFVGVASSIVICFAFFVLQQLGLALGTRGSLPTWVAAWGPNVSFALVGLALSWRMR